MSDPLNHLASMPGVSHTTMTRKQLQALLLDTDGQVMAAGGLWEVASKHLGAGIYRVYLAPFRGLEADDDS